MYILQAIIWLSVLASNAAGHWTENWFSASAVGMFMAWGVTHSIAMISDFVKDLAANAHRRRVRRQVGIIVPGEDVHRVVRRLRLTGRD
jgi:hypothetical protein